MPEDEVVEVVEELGDAVGGGDGDVDGCWDALVVEVVFGSAGWVGFDAGAGREVGVGLDVVVGTDAVVVVVGAGSDVGASSANTSGRRTS
jgi:hypothetical protein